MNLEKQSSESIYKTLNDLIELKARRDNTKFTASQLAQCLNLPRSSIQRLIHPDSEKRVTNPTIETLLKIVSFFQKDGFFVTINDFLKPINRPIEIRNQKENILQKNVSVPVYNEDLEKEESYVNISVAQDVDDSCLIAYRLNENLPPIFNKGSIFIIDQDKMLHNNHLLAIKYDNGISFVKYYKKHGKKIFQPLNESPKRKNEIIS